MSVCDICNEPGRGTIVSAEQIRKAVFSKGFDPFSLGLVGGAAFLYGSTTKARFQRWKNSVVAQDASDWNICAGCMAKLRPYLDGSPRGSGVTSSRVSTDPIVGEIMGFMAEVKYGNGEASPGGNSHDRAKKKKWWQFWK